MPKPKPISQILGNGRGAYRKAFLSMLLQEYSQKEAKDLAERELGKKCIYCGISAREVNLQADHLWPEEIGGIHVIGNVVPACPTCNSKRGNKDWKLFLEEHGKTLGLNSLEIDDKIKTVTQYMETHSMNERPTIEKVLSLNELEMRGDLDILLDAISQGLRAKVGKPQVKEVKFKNANIMFDEMVKVAKKFLN